MTSFYANIQSIADVKVKIEPVEEPPAQIMPVDDYDDDDEQQMPPPPPRRAYDSDDDIDDKVPPPRPGDSRSSSSVSRTTVGPIQTSAVANEATVRNVVLTPTSAVLPLNDASLALPHENNIYSIDSYFEPSQNESAAASSGERTNDPTNTPAAFVNYMLTRMRAGGAPSRPRSEKGFSNQFISLYLNAPPSRSLPASNSTAAQVRLAATPVDWCQFVELCATPRPSEPSCVSGKQCHALTICNEFGQRINNTPFVCMWFAHERSKMLNTERQAFYSEWAARMCLCCQIEYAARMYVWSCSTNSAVNTTSNSKGAVSWFVLVQRGGEFYIQQTFGPDASCFNGFIGNIPRPQVNGWSVRESNQTSRIAFNPPYLRYPSENETAGRDSTRGF